MKDELGLFVIDNGHYIVHQPAPYIYSGWFISESGGEFHLFNIDKFGAESVLCGSFHSLQLAYNIAFMLK